MHRCLAALAIAAAFTFPAAAQMARSFPAHALRGTLVVTQPPEVLLNGEPARLAPGARIRDAENMQVLSGALVGQPLLVHYTVELTGQIHQVWLLRPDEAARKPWPTTPEQAAKWLFDPAAQVWTKP